MDLSPNSSVEPGRPFEQALDFSRPVLFTRPVIARRELTRPVVPPVGAPSEDPFLEGADTRLAH